MVKRTQFRVPFETEYRVAGIFCPERDYRFGWLLNSVLKFNFSRTADFPFLPAKSTNPDNFSVFIYDKEEMHQTFFLINNHSFLNKPLFPAPPGLDFLLLVKADESRFDFDNLLKRLRSIPQVTAAYMLDNALGKQKETFLYDFEVFVSQELKM